MVFTSPIACLDIESSGKKPHEDRIIQLYIWKINPDGTNEHKEWICNPEVPIDPSATSVHGYTNEMVADKPTFNQVAIQVLNFLDGCSALVTYNGNKFDLPMLWHEFGRSGIDWDYRKYKFIDVYGMVQRLHPRTLSAMYKYYTGQDLESAHNASNDVVATMSILFNMFQKHPELPESLEELELFSNNDKPVTEISGTFSLDDNNQLIFAKGKHEGKTIEWVANNDSGYINWMSRATNPPFSKEVLSIISKFTK